MMAGTKKATHISGWPGPYEEKNFNLFLSSLQRVLNKALVNHFTAS
jgi:hypothetical protein